MKKIIVLGLFIILGTVATALNFSIYPTKFEVDLTKSNTYEMYIVNNTDLPLRVGITPESDPNFGADYNLNSIIRVFPKTVSVKPAGKQVVRFRITPSKDIKEGEYKSHITFTEIPSAIKTKNVSLDSISSEVQMITSILISVYGKGDNSIVEGGIKNLSYQFDKGILTLSGIGYSIGNTSLKFDYSLEGKGIKSEGRLANSPRTGEGNISTSINLENAKKGDKVNLIIKDQNGKVCYSKTLTL